MLFLCEGEFGNVKSKFISMIFTIFLLSTGGILKNEVTKEDMDFLTSFNYLNSSSVWV